MAKTKILVCAATGTEASACAAGILQAGLLGECFEVLKTGIGAEAAAKSLERRLQRGAKPQLILSGGFAGSWIYNLHVGQWISGERVTQDQNADPEMFTLSPFDFAEAATVCSVNAIYETPPRALLQKLIAIGRPVAVDMESFALAQVAFKNEIRFGILRYITDSPSQPLPPFVRYFTDVATDAGLGDKARSLLQGTQSLFSELPQVVPLLRNGTRWREELVEGWARFSKLLFESVRDG